MRFKIKSRFLLVYVAVLYGFYLLILCGDISLTGGHSLSSAHRRQTNALLHGQLALSHNPLTLAHDLCWSEGGVNQVWGLGISFWQLPFEAVAQWLGLAPFPDRVSLALFMAFVAYAVMRTCFATQTNANSASSPIPLRYGRLTALGAICVFLFFPPLLNILHYRMWVYEEVMVYTYFFGIALACGVASLAGSPTWRRFWLLCALAGLGGLVRPTLIFYGCGTLAVAATIMVCRERSQAGDIKSSALGYLINWRVALGILLFGAGGGLLYLTNLLRFGNGLEFGHRLNLQTANLLPSVYSTRFDYPFRHARFFESFRELLGALFHVNYLNGMDWYAPGIVAGQSSVFRWREFSFGTYDFFYAIGIVCAWAIAVRALWRRILRLRSPIAAESNGTQTLPTHLVLIIWSWIPCLILTGLFIKVPVIASRYMLDFAPAFATSLVGLWFWMMERSRQKQFQKKWAPCLLALLLAGQGLEIFFSKRLPTPPEPIDREAAKLNLAEIKFSSETFPREYKVGDSVNFAGIPFNGAGWDSDNGTTGVCAIFFVKNPQFLELELLPAEHTLMTEASLSTIKAKIGLDFLTQDSALSTNGAWIVRFSAPPDSKYRSGVQPAFLAMVPPEQLGQYATVSSPWILKRLSWRKE